MKEPTEIPSGYQLSVTTWENDADNYRTETLSGLTKEDVRFYLHFLSHFRSRWSAEKGSGFGNTEPSAEKERTALESAWHSFPPSSLELAEAIQCSLNAWGSGYKYSCDWCNELVGTWSYGERYRVFDSFKVHFFQDPAPDVTDEFPDFPGDA